MKQKGKIYLDVESLAITALEYKGDIEIPLLIKPVLFLYGFSVENAMAEEKIQYHEVNGKWYPKDFKATFSGGITKSHWFSANEHSYFTIGNLLFINKIETDKPAPISEVKRFKSNKKFEEQVFNDAGITWSEMNMIPSME